MQQFIDRFAWENIKQDVLSAGWRLLVALIILLIGFFLVNRLVDLVGKRFLQKPTDQTLNRFLRTFLKFSLKVVVFITALDYLGSFTATITTIVGAVTLSIGLSLQGALQNLAGGILIVTYRPFKLGDYILVDTFEGTVDDIGILSTVLRTVDNRKLILPNGKVAAEYLTNYSGYDMRRLDVNVRVDYESDLARVRKLLLEIAATENDVLAHPPAEVHPYIEEDKTMGLKLKVWTKTNDYWPVYWSLIEKVQTSLLANNILLPHPYLNVVMKQNRDTDT